MIGAFLAGLMIALNCYGLRSLMSASACAIFILGGMMTMAPLVLATAIGLLAGQETSSPSAAYRFSAGDGPRDQPGSSRRGGGLGRSASLLGTGRPDRR